MTWPKEQEGQCQQMCQKVGLSSPESSAFGGLAVPTAALAAVGFDIVEADAREESLGPESSKTMAGVSDGGK